LSSKSAALSYPDARSSFLVTWRRNKGIEMSYTPWTARCCELLSQRGQTQGDLVLAAQARIAGILFQVSKTMHNPDGNSLEDRRIMLAGHKSELLQYESSLPSSLRDTSKSAQRILKPRRQMK
jgi:hypothetical protein